MPKPSSTGKSISAHGCKNKLKYSAYSVIMSAKQDRLFQKEMVSMAEIFDEENRTANLKTKDSVLRCMMNSVKFIEKSLNVSEKLLKSASERDI